MIPSFLTDSYDWASQRVNPIVVKEARQSVRSRGVLAGIVLLLAILMVITLGHTLGRDPSEFNRAVGGGLFNTFNSITLFMCGLFIPFMTAQRFTSEQKGATADLMYTTTIKPSAMVWGKLTVSLLLGVLMISVAAPFMAMSYMYKGIDIPTILFWIGMNFVTLLAASSLGVFLAAIELSKVLRILLGLALVPIGLWLIGGIYGANTWNGMQSVTAYGRIEWLWIGSLIAVVVFLIGLLFTLSVAASSSESSNRAKAPRIYLSLGWIATLALAMGLVPSVGSNEPYLVWGICWIVMGALATIAAAGERRVLGVRVRAGIPQNPLLRFFALFTTSNAASGLCWAAVLQLATYLATVGLLYEPGDWEWEERLELIYAMLPLTLFVVGYSLLGAILRDRLLKFKTSTTISIPLALAGMAIVSVVPMILAFIITDGRGEDISSYLLLSPFGGLSILAERGGELWPPIVLSAVFAVVMLLVCSAWFARQFAQFSPLATSEKPPTEPITAAVNSQAEFHSEDAVVDEAMLTDPEADRG